jgi:Sodium/hydrogen exchanger family
VASATFGAVVLVIAAAVLAATVSTGASERLRIPAPAFFLLAAAAAADVWPGLRGLPFSAVEQVVTVALAVILFDGGMALGWRPFRGAAARILGLGTAGTLATAGGVAATAHLVFGLDWRVALLLGAAAAAGGSGFLAVFVAGLVLGDARPPHQREVVRFHAALSSLAEIVAFAVLGLTIHLGAVAQHWVWLVGVGLAVTLAVVIRPLVAWLLLRPVRLAGRDRLLVAWAGLNGAVRSCSARPWSRRVSPARSGCTRSFSSSSRSPSWCRAAPCRGWRGGSGPAGRDHSACAPLAEGAFIPAQHGVTRHQHEAANLTTPCAAGGARGRRHQAEPHPAPWADVLSDLRERRRP